MGIFPRVGGVPNRAKYSLSPEEPCPCVFYWHLVWSARTGVMTQDAMAVVVLIVVLVLGPMPSKVTGKSLGR